MVFAAREQMLEFNVPVMLALESMMVGLLPRRDGAGAPTGRNVR